MSEKDESRQWRATRDIMETISELPYPRRAVQIIASRFGFEAMTLAGYFGREAEIATLERRVAALKRRNVELARRESK